MKQVKNIVITGGPCSGKTTGLSKIEQALSYRGYYVLVVPETATELIPNGIRPFGNSLSMVQFQYVVFNKQLYKENIYRNVAKTLIPSDKIVIIHDRGIMDNKSYVNEEEFKKILQHFNMNEVEARDRYDAVFHLVTAADGAEGYYTLANNAARTETMEEARALDKKGISNWTGHQHFRIIDNSTGFDAKMDRLIHEVFTFLGEPTPLEIEKKFLIKKPNMSEMAKLVPFTTVSIVQTYLRSEKGTERRVRQRGQDGNFSYYFTEKKAVSLLSRIEVERKISAKEYINYLTEADPDIPPIIKKRTCFVYKGQYFKLDVFDFSNHLAILEIELASEDSEIQLPDFIDVFEDVSYNPFYRNISLAKARHL